MEGQPAGPTGRQMDLGARAFAGQLLVYRDVVGIEPFGHVHPSSAAQEELSAVGRPPGRRVKGAHGDRHRGRAPEASSPRRNTSAREETVQGHLAPRTSIAVGWPRCRTAAHATSKNPPKRCATGVIPHRATAPGFDAVRASASRNCSAGGRSSPLGHQWRRSSPRRRCGATCVSAPPRSTSPAVLPGKVSTGLGVIVTHRYCGMCFMLPGFIVIVVAHCADSGHGGKWTAWPAAPRSGGHHLHGH